MGQQYTLQIDPAWRHPVEAAYEAQMRERFKAQREVPLNGPPQERIIATGAAHFDNQAMRQCPECGKEIRAVARLCRFCKVRF